MERRGDGRTTSRRTVGVKPHLETIWLPAEDRMIDGTTRGRTRRWAVRSGGRMDRAQTEDRLTSRWKHERRRVCLARRSLNDACNIFCALRNGRRRRRRRRLAVAAAAAAAVADVGEAIVADTFSLSPARQLSLLQATRVGIKTAHRAATTRSV